MDWATYIQAVAAILAVLVFLYRVVRAVDKIVRELRELNRQQEANHEALKELTARVVIQEQRRNRR